MGYEMVGLNIPFKWVVQCTPNLYFKVFHVISTTAGARRVKKGSSVLEASASNSHTTKESEASSKSGISAMLFPTSSQPPAHVDSAQVSI